MGRISFAAYFSCLLINLLCDRQIPDTRKITGTACAAEDTASVSQRTVPVGTGHAAKMCIRDRDVTAYEDLDIDSFKKAVEDIPQWYEEELVKEGYDKEEVRELIRAFTSAEGSTAEYSMEDSDVYKRQH